MVLRGASSIHFISTIMITRYFNRGTLNCVMSLLLRRIHREEEVNKILGLKKPTLLSLFEHINKYQQYSMLSLIEFVPKDPASLWSVRIRRELASDSCCDPAILSILYCACANDNWSEDSTLVQGQCLKFLLEIPLML